MSKPYKPIVWVDVEDLTDTELLGIKGFADTKLIPANDCMEWGYTRLSGNSHSVTIKTLDTSTVCRVRTLDALMKIAGKPVSPTSLYYKTCGNKRCMNVEHCLLEDPQYPLGVNSPEYQADYKMAYTMFQWGWAIKDVVASTSHVVSLAVKEHDIIAVEGFSDRYPLSYAELLRIAEVLARVGDKGIHIDELVKQSKVEYDRLLPNGAAVKALRRRMNTEINRDTVVWFLTDLCRHNNVLRACVTVNKTTSYGVQLLGACYG